MARPGGRQSFAEVAPGNGAYAYLIKAMALNTTASVNYTNTRVGTYSSTGITLP